MKHISKKLKEKFADIVTNSKTFLLTYTQTNILFISYLKILNELK